ncbi:MAG TPA: hypothetical protein VFZ91_10145 [Allosphingosinicella sp.]
MREGAAAIIIPANWGRPPIASSRPFRAGPALLALLASGCGALGDCLPPKESAERAEFRQYLRGLVHISPCPGPPTPTRLRAQEAETWRRKTALLDRVRTSPLAEDLAQAIREDQEWSRNLYEADCVFYDLKTPDTPRNIADYRAGLEAERRQLSQAETAFARLTVRCAAG